MKVNEVKCKMQIRLDTETEVARLVTIASRIPREAKVEVVDGEGMRVNARSILGMMYAMTFNELWLESNIEVYEKFKEFAID